MKHLGTPRLTLAAIAITTLFGWLILSVWSTPTHASIASNDSSTETAVPTALPTGMDPNSGYPLALGNTWVYSSTRYEGFNPSLIMTATQTITETVMEIKNTPSFFAAKMRQETSADKPVSIPKDMEDMLRPASTTEYWLIAQDKRIYRQEREEPDPTNLHDPDSLELVFPLQFGDKWNWLPARPPTEPQTSGIAREVVQTGPVFLPTSHFGNCSLIKEVWADSTINDWFCPGVGWVEKDSDHNGTPVGTHIELVKFWVSNQVSAPTSNGAPLLIWQDEQHGCKSLVVGADDNARYGTCDSLQTAPSISNVGNYWDRWPDFYNRFAPFQMRTKSQEILFRGQGKASASPARQRAIAAWALVAEQQLEMGRTGASWAAALAWSGPIADRPGYCRGLQIESYGYAYISTGRCAGGDPRNVAEGWLDDSEWEQFDGWYFGRAAFERGRAKFFGRGTLEMSPTEFAQLDQWAESVYARLETGASQTLTPTPTPYQSVPDLVACPGGPDTDEVCLSDGWIRLAGYVDASTFVQGDPVLMRGVGKTPVLLEDSDGKPFDYLLRGPSTLMIVEGRLTSFTPPTLQVQSFRSAARAMGPLTETYTNTRIGFAIDYSSGWIVEDNTSASGGLVSIQNYHTGDLPFRASVDPALYKIEIVPIRPSQATTLAEMRSQIQGKVVHELPITIGNVSAIRLAVDTESHGPTDILLVQLTGRMLLLQTWQEPGLFDKMIQSLRTAGGQLHPLRCPLRPRPASSMSIH